MTPYRTLLVSLAFLFLASPWAGATAFGEYNNFPAQAGNPLSTPAGGALGDGRLVVWNGLGLYEQPFVGVDQFVEIATGYEGDPAFVSVSPDGHTLLLGAGGFMDDYTGYLYVVDAHAPVDFGPEDSPALVASHFGGAWLSDTLVILDAGTPSWDSELTVWDISAKSAPVAVVAKPAAAKDSIVAKPGYSSSIAVDFVNGRVYVMDAATVDLRYFDRGDLIAAFQGGYTLDWATDSTPVGTPGTFFTGGVAGITPEGNLIISGSEGYLMPGGVQIVAPDTGIVVETIDPSGVGEYTNVIYNPVTDQMTVLAGGSVCASGGLVGLPAAGMAGLGALGLVLVACGRKVLLRRC